MSFLPAAGRCGLTLYISGCCPSNSHSASLRISRAQSRALLSLRSLLSASPLAEFYSTISPRVCSFAREVAPGYRACENPGVFLFIKFLFSFGSVFCGIIFFGVEVEGEQQREAGKEEKEEEEENCRSVEEGTSLL